MPFPFNPKNWRAAVEPTVVNTWVNPCHLLARNRSRADAYHIRKGGHTSNARNCQMQIEVEKTDGDAVIKLSGRLDINTSPNLRTAALKLYTKRKCKNLIVDFAEVSFIDTSGLATLVEILVTAKEQCAQLTLSAMNAKVRYLIDVNGLSGFFTIEGSAPEKLYA